MIHECHHAVVLFRQVHALIKSTVILCDIIKKFKCVVRQETVSHMLQNQQPIMDTDGLFGWMHMVYQLFQ